MPAIQITPSLTLPDNELEFTAIRAQGAGGQNVNKVASAIHLRFDISSSSLPDEYKNRLLTLRDHRITRDGCIIIKAQQYRTQEKNREDAIERLAQLIRSVTIVQKRRKPTRPSKTSRAKRVNAKVKRGQDKALRKKIL